MDVPRHSKPHKAKVAPTVEAKKYFDEFVASAAGRLDRFLPLTHTTDAYTLRDIIGVGQIDPQYCQVFNASLSYFYYGRPAYRKNGATQANTIAAYAPIVFVVRPEVCSDASRAFPFDSGAFRGEQYDDLTHHKMRIEDFEIEPSLARFGSIVNYFYGNNTAYFDQKSETQPKVPVEEHEVQVYRRLVYSDGKNARDDRSTTIEILFDRALSLENYLMAVVVPMSLYSDRGAKSKLNKLRCDILPYGDGARINPAAYTPLLNDIVRRYFFKKGILS